MKTSSCVYLKVSIFGVLPRKRVYYTLKNILGKEKPLIFLC